MEEIWRDIKGYEGHYQVSNLGNVRSLNKSISAKRDKMGDFAWTHKGRILSQELTNTEAYRITLSKDGKTKRYLTHRIVAETFIDNSENKPEVNHVDGDRRNNKVDNLEWCTGSENMHHAYKTGLQVPLYGEKHQNRRITSEQVEFIRKNYRPFDKEFSGKALAEKFNTSPKYIREIVKMKARKVG